MKLAVTYIKKKYTSKNIKNELIDSNSSKILKTILKKIKASKYPSIYMGRPSKIWPRVPHWLGPALHIYKATATLITSFIELSQLLRCFVVYALRWLLIVSCIKIEAIKKTGFVFFLLVNSPIKC